MGDKHPVSVRHGQTCFFMVFHTMLRQISNFCFCAISSREFLSALFFTLFTLTLKKMCWLFSFTCITSTFRQACLLSFPRWEQLPNGIPHLTINISFHRRFPFSLFFSPILLTWPNSPTWKTWPTKLTSSNNQHSLSPSFAFFSLGEKLSPIYPRRRT